MVMIQDHSRIPDRNSSSIDKDVESFYHVGRIDIPHKNGEDYLLKFEESTSYPPQQSQILLQYANLRALIVPARVPD